MSYGGYNKSSNYYQKQSRPNTQQGGGYYSNSNEVEHSSNYNNRGGYRGRGRGGGRGRGRGGRGRSNRGGYGGNQYSDYNKYQNTYNDSQQSGQYYNDNTFQNHPSYEKGKGGQSYQNYNQEMSNKPQHQQEEYYYEDNFDDGYIPEEVVQRAKGKGNIIVKEISYDQGNVYKDDLVNDYHDEDTYGGDSYKDLQDDYYEDEHDYEKDYNEVDNQMNQMKIGERRPGQGQNQTQSKGYQEGKSSNPQFRNLLTFTNESGFTQLVNDMINNDRYKQKEVTDSYVNVLMIAEKPSIAKMISEVLSNHKAQQKNVGRGKVLITFEGYFKNAKARFTISAVAGHVYTSDFLQEHNRWDAIDAGDLYEVPVVKLEAMKKAHMPEGLQRLAYGKDILCLWLDCDKEGENICYEVIYNAFPQMNKKNYQQIYRAKFSSLTQKDLKVAFDNLSDPPNMNESLSVDSRQVIDLKIGVSFTRFLTSSILPGLDTSTTVLSYGPCQTPTLWFCVNRQKEIHSFIPKDYYKPYVEVEINLFRHTIFYNKRIFDIKELNSLMNKIKEVKTVKVIDSVINKNTKAAPAGLNTVSLLRVASSYLKISPHNTMIIAEKLYTMGFITYPRTETTKYSSSFDFFGALRNFEGHSVFGKNVSVLVKSFQKPSLKGVDVGDHPPITPARVATFDQLKGDHWRLYEFICTHFFASLSQAAEYQEITYKIDANGEIFEESAMQITKEGFLLFSPHKRKNYMKDFPILKIGAEYTVRSVNYQARQTEPPGYLTESDLIKDMEKNHIGTDASMSVHIENICQRGYVRVDEARRLIPTKLGKGLIEALSEVDPEIVHPNARAKIEGLVEEISSGKKRYNEVLKYALDLYKAKYTIIRVNFDKLLNAFGKYYTLDKSKLNKAIKDVRDKNNQFKKETYIQKRPEDVTTDINECDECHKGKMYIDYDKYDKFCLFCTDCKRRTKIIRDALKIEVNRSFKCQKCNSYYIDVEVENPFLNGDTTYTGCLLCDRHLS